MSDREQLEALDELHRRFEGQGLQYWLFGGWAVDFHLGTITRRHGDLDLAIWLRDLPAVTDLLAQAGWRHEDGDAQDGSTVVTRGDVRVELAFLEHDDGEEPYTPLSDGSRAPWAAGAFGEEMRTLEGVRARVIGLAALREEKSGLHDDPAAAEKDRADRQALEGLG